jgi:hypothetical protein
MSGQQAESGVSWFDGILAERQVYVRGRGRPYFMTITRRARVARALALLVLILAFAGTAAGLAGAWRLNGSLRAELASLRADVARSGGDERAVRLRAEAELAQEREGWAAASRSRAAELEAQLQRAASAPVATLASIEPDESAVVPQPEQREDVRAELTAALTRLKELESYVGRRAPAPPAQAPR